MLLLEESCSNSPAGNLTFLKISQEMEQEERRMHIVSVNIALIIDSLKAQW